MSLQDEILEKYSFECLMCDEFRSNYLIHESNLPNIINKVLDAAIEAVFDINGATFTCKNRQAPIVVIVERSWKEGKHIRRDDAIKAIQALKVDASEEDNGN